MSSAPASKYWGIPALDEFAGMLERRIHISNLAQQYQAQEPELDPARKELWEARAFLAKQQNWEQQAAKLPPDQQLKGQQLYLEMLPITAEKFKEYTTPEQHSSIGMMAAHRADLDKSSSTHLHPSFTTLS
jgi:hypothetical protein